MSTLSRHRNQDRSAALVVALAFLCFIVLGMPAGLLNIAWPSIRELFQLAQEQVGTLLLASQIGYIAASFGSGRFAERFGNGRLLFAGSLCAAVGLAGYAVASSWVMMVGIGLLVGLGGGALDGGMNAYFAMNFGPRLMNWLHASFGIGSTVGPILLTALLVGGYSWRWGYVAAGVAQGTVALAFLFTLPWWHTRANLDDDASVPDAPATAEGLSPATNRSAPVGWVDVGLSVLVFFCIAGVEMAAGQWSFVLFTESRGVAVGPAGTWVSIYWASFTVGRIIFGIFGNRIPVLGALRASIGALLVGALLLWWPGASWVGFLGLVLMGLGIAPLFPLLMTATPRRLGRRRAAHVIGYQVAAASLGIAFVPGTAGFLMQRLSPEIIGPFLLVISAILLVLHEALERRRPLNRDG